MKRLFLGLLFCAIVQTITAQNNYRDFEFTIDTSEYKFWSSNDYLDYSAEGWVEPNITVINNGEDERISDFDLTSGEYRVPALPYVRGGIILPYGKVIDSCVLTLHDVYTWKENITLSSTSPDSLYGDLPCFGLMKKTYADGIYPLPKDVFAFMNDVNPWLPQSAWAFSPFIYDSYKKTLKVASSATVRVYYKEGILQNFQMGNLEECYLYPWMLEMLLNPEDLDEYIRQADDPIDKLAAGLTISQSGRECTFQFAQPLLENANLYLYKTDGMLYRTILVEQGATSVTVTIGDAGMYLYRILDQKGKIVVSQ